jgi:methylated-DNA-[protein]-cysteine S-methyltransferase
MTVYTRRFATPFGQMTAAVDTAGRLFRLLYEDERHKSIEGAGDVIAESPRCDEVVRQLDEYFAQKRREFDLPLALHGTPFQQTVWAELQSIPYGVTISYRELAERIGKPAAIRAVGGANATNPIPIIVPCHRVIGADGSLTGYGGGIQIKEQLLRLEGVPNLQFRLTL